MNAPGRVVVWVCAAVVALPLSPCAFFSIACCTHDVPAAAEVAQASQRPCCAQHSEPARQPSPKHPQKKPCSGDCCRVSPFTKGGEKLVLPAIAPALLAVLPHFDVASVGDAMLPASAASQLVSLRVLHCQWRL
jgi:hypothetical protein